nr:hypothetical protein CFP56_11477 [Quercus suber]
MVDVSRDEDGDDLRSLGQEINDQHGEEVAGQHRALSSDAVRARVGDGLVFELVVADKAGECFRSTQ